MRDPSRSALCVTPQPPRSRDRKVATPPTAARVGGSPDPQSRPALDDEGQPLHPHAVPGTAGRQCARALPVSPAEVAPSGPSLCELIVAFFRFAAANGLRPHQTRLFHEDTQTEILLDPIRPAGARADAEPAAYHVRLHSLMPYRTLAFGWTVAGERIHWQCVSRDGDAPGRPHNQEGGVTAIPPTSEQTPPSTDVSAGGSPDPQSRHAADAPRSVARQVLDEVADRR